MQLDDVDNKTETYSLREFQLPIKQQQLPLIILHKLDNCDFHHTYTPRKFTRARTSFNLIVLGCQPVRFCGGEVTEEVVRLTGNLYSDLRSNS